MQGGYQRDTVCNCRRPDSQYTTQRYVRAPALVITHRRVVVRRRVVRGTTRLIQENRLIVHVRPVIHREVIGHRTRTIVKDPVLHRINKINKYRDVNRTPVFNVRGGGTVHHVTEYRNMRGVNCNCGYESRSYRGPLVSYRY